MKFTLSFFLMASLFAGVSLAEVPSKTLVKKYKSALGEIQESEKKQRAILAQLYYINRRIKKETNKKAELEDKKNALKRQVSSVAKEYLRLEQEIQLEKRKLVTRIRVLATLGAKDFARVLFNSKSAADIDRSLYLIGKVARKDLDLIVEYRDKLDQIAVKREKLELKNAEYEKVAKEHDEKLAELKGQQKQRFSLIAKIRKSKQFYLSKLKDYRYTAKGMSEEERSQIADLILRPSFFEKKGKIPLPVHGRLRRFEPTNPKDHKVALSTKSVFIDSEPKAEVRSNFKAKVEYADFVSGYRGLVILDHGDNYYSIFGNLERIGVSEGQSVAPGEVIGEIGSRSWRGRLGLFYEIRHFSEPEDPFEWLQRDERYKLSKNKVDESL